MGKHFCVIRPEKREIRFFLNSLCGKYNQYEILPSLYNFPAVQAYFHCGVFYVNFKQTVVS
jgi:hypothetical protein